MPDIEARLGALGPVLESAVPEIEAAKIIESVGAPSSVRRPTRRGLAVAFAAAALMFLVIAVVVLLDPFGSEGPFIEEPTTIPTSSVNLSSFVFLTDQVPSFSATIAYDMNPGGEEEHGVEPGTIMTSKVLWNGPDDYLYSVVFVDPPVGPEVPFGLPGLSVLGAGDRTWVKEPDDAPMRPGANFGGPSHLLWDSRYPAWDEICSTGRYQALGVDTIAGRLTVHGLCSTLTQDYELWVDTETGVVMKLRGALAIGPYWPDTTRDGGFEIVEFEIGGVELPEAPAAEDIGEVSAMPPFHAIRAQEYASGELASTGFTQEIWYQDEATWKWETTDSTIEEGGAESAVGSFQVMADGYLAHCDASGPYCWETEAPQDFLLPVTTVPVEALAENCDLIATETVLGRAADHYLCDRWFIEYSNEVWAPGPPGSAEEHHWVDRDTAIRLRYESSFSRIWLTTLEINPLFPAGVFDYELLVGTGPEGEECPADDPVCQVWSETLLVKGEPAPVFSGPLLDGSTFSLEDLRGHPAVVFRWGDSFAPGVLEQYMDDFQALSEKWGDQVGFLGAPEEPNPDDVQRIMDRGEYTFDNVVCYDPEALEAGSSNVVCEPEDVGQLWRIGWPAWVVIDEDGRVFDAFVGMAGTYEHIDSVIEAIVNS